MRRPVYEIVIFGTSDFARVARKIADESGHFATKAFVVDSGYLIDSELDNLPVVDSNSASLQFPSDSFSMFVAVGYKSIGNRGKLFERWQSQGYHLINIFADGAIVSSDVAFGYNNIVFPGTVIEPGAQLGDNNVAWSNSTICHHTIIGSHNFLAANTTIGGNVTVGDRCFVGFSSTVFHGLKVGNQVLIAAQTLVTRDAEDNGEYRGIPAKRWRNIQPSEGISIG